MENDKVMMMSQIIFIEFLGEPTFTNFEPVIY